MKDEKLYCRDGKIYYNSHDTESINAALVEAVKAAQVAGYNQGAEKFNYKKGYEKGLLHGTLGLLGCFAVGYVMAWIFGKGKK